MPTYIHERAEWPQFRWDDERLLKRLGEVRHAQGKLTGKMESLGFDLKTEATLRTLTEDVVKSSEIEGEILNQDQVRSSIARRLGIEIGALTPTDRNVEGVVEMMLDATQKFDKPLTRERLFAWHAALFPTGRSGMQKITVGAWRKAENDPMQVVSGYAGKERVHFEAPGGKRLAREMTAFLKWFEKDDGIDPVLRAAIAHLWFVTIHPFQDGNGRIARAIADMALARSERSNQRFYSMSAQIRVESKAYYDILESTQKGGDQITGWLEWFLECLGRAIDGAEDILMNVLGKAAFWQRHAATPLNDRQRAMINRLLEGFDGKLTSSKWATITKVSQDTAGRDIQGLMDAGILQKDDAGGRSTSYRITTAHNAWLRAQPTT